MGPTSAKFDSEMEDKDGQNPIQTTEIFAAADAGERAETSAISARECSRRCAEEAYSADARALCFDRQWSDHRCARDPNPRRRSPGRKRRESNERQIARNTTSLLRVALHAHDLETAVGEPGADLPCAGVCLTGTELLEPRSAGSQ